MPNPPSPSNLAEELRSGAPRAGSDKERPSERTAEEKDTHPVLTPEKPSVFISYAHEDSRFVGKLRDALTRIGIEPTGDWLIKAGESYLARLRLMILNSTAFIFIISPDSIKSPECKNELSIAVENHKPILPVAHRDHSHDGLLDSALRSRQWTFLRSSDDFPSGIETLANGVRTDFGLSEIHASLLIAAEDWLGRGKNPSYLLRKIALRNAEEWLEKISQLPQKIPQPTPLQIEFIFASQRERSRGTRRIALVATVVALALSALSFLALLQRAKALRNAKEANRQRLHAEEEKTLALARQLTAQSELARSSPAKESAVQSLLLAVQAYRYYPTPEGNLVLRRALAALPSKPIAKTSIQGGQYSLPVVDALGFNETGDFLRLSSPDGSKSWDFLRKTARTMDASVFRSRFLSAKFSPNGNFMASIEGTLTRVWNATTKEQIGQVASASVPQDMAFSRDERSLAIVDNDGRISLFDLPSRRETWNAAHKTKAKIARFDNQSRLLATGASSIALIQRTIDSDYPGNNIEIIHQEVSPSTIRLWDVRTGKEDGRLPPQAVNLLDLRFSPDGQDIASVGANDPHVRFWDIKSGKEVMSLKEDGSPFAIQFSPDGRYLATAVVGKRISFSLWDVKSRQLLAHLQPADAGLISDLAEDDLSWLPKMIFFAFSSEGRFLITRIYNTAAWVWEIPSGREVTHLDGLSYGAPRLVVTSLRSDGKYVAAANVNEVTVWYAWWLDDPVSVACNRFLTRNLMPREWSEFVGPTVNYERTCPNLP